LLFQNEDAHEVSEYLCALKHAPKGAIEKPFVFVTGTYRDEFALGRPEETGTETVEGTRCE